MLVLTVLLFHKGRKHQHSLILAIYALVEVITNGLVSLSIWGGNDFFDQFPYSHFIYKPLYTLWVPLFYFYIKSSFTSKFEWNKKRLVHFIPFVFFLIFFLGIWVFKGNYFIWENLYHHGSFIYNVDFSIDIFTKIQYVVYNFVLIKSLLRIEKNRKKTSKNKTSFNIKWMRFIVYGYATGCFIATLNFVAFIYKSPLLSSLNIVSITYFFLFFFAIFYDTITHKPYELSPKANRTTIPNNSMRALMKKINELIKDKQLFLNPELTLQQTALELNEKERDISKAINTIQNRNFKDYLSSYRIDHACKLLISDTSKPIFEIMYESGFNTKGAFNLAFKKITGKTPTEYRDNYYYNN